MTDNTDRPTTGVGCYILNDKGEILLTKTIGKWGDAWNIPAGRQECGEKIGETAEREALEEVGIRAKFDRIICVLDIINPPDYPRKIHILGIQCLLHVEGDQQPKIDGTEISEAKWVSIADALAGELHPLTREGIETLVQLWDEKVSFKN